MPAPLLVAVAGADAEAQARQRVGVVLPRLEEHAAGEFDVVVGVGGRGVAAVGGAVEDADRVVERAVVVLVVDEAVVAARGGVRVVRGERRGVPRDSEAFDSGGSRDLAGRFHAVRPEKR